MTDTDNRRIDHRFPTYVATRFRLLPKDAEPGEWQIATMLTASTRGAFLQTSLGVRVGDALAVVLPTTNETITLRGRVAWLSAERPQGFGMTFRDVDPALAETIQAEISSGRWLAEKGEERKKSESGFFSSDIRDLLKDV